MVFEWKDKVVFITGAASGIGAGVVRLVLEEGAKHVAFIDVAKTPGEELERKLNSKHGSGKVKFYFGDVTKDSDLHAVFDSVVATYGYLDVVINNAGLLNDRKDKYKKEIEVNFTATVSSTLRALELMRKDEGGKGGTIINIASVVALCQTPWTPIYVATKSAVLQFSNCVGLDDYYLRTDVRVLCVCFGTTDTTLLFSDKWGTFDRELEANLDEVCRKNFVLQKPESASKGVVEVYKKGASGSTWVVEADLPAKDITDSVKEAYRILGETMAK